MEAAELLASQGSYDAARRRLWALPPTAAHRTRLQGYMLRLAQVHISGFVRQAGRRDLMSCG